ncbi:MAG: hypothetical protein A2017_03680 [Lentisphaerae bacterium GWF2_44_16]|nr:MAG: hypothetical protein A2017_03680 [Lentisphaerae bacterium GWF2_44_16]
MLSKVDIIKEKILNDIKTGRMKPGSALPSRHQFMRRFGCARGSIDAAINELSRGGFLYSRQGSGTFVAEKSAAKSISEVFLIGDFDYTRSMGLPMQSGNLAAEIQRHLPCYVYHRNDVNVNLGKIMRPGSAVIWVRPSYNELMVMQYIEKAGIPQLLIGRNFGNFDHIRTDAKEGIKEGLEWLKRQGGSELSFIAVENNPDYPYIAERQIAFYESTAELDMKVRADWLFIMPFRNISEDVNRIAEKLFTKKRLPRFVFLTFIGAAMPLITLAESRGYLPGRDFHILIFDDVQNFYGRKGIGMLRQRWEEMDDMALEWVLQYRKGAAERVFQKKIKPDFIKE